MFNIGIDLIEIERIEKSINNPKFISRIFSDDEINMFKLRKYNPATIAANFAAKEALAKALQIGLAKLNVKYVSVLRNKNGQPYFKFNPEIMDIMDNKQILLSISHSKTSAVAVVVIHKNF